MRRVLLIASTTGYQTRAFGDAAERLGVDLVLATDRCHQLEDPWSDGAIAVRFQDEQASLDALDRSLADRPVDGVLAVGDQPALLAALASERFGLPGHPPDAARACGNKLASRRRLRAAGLPCPSFEVRALQGEGAAASAVGFPCVVKPLTLAGSRGVIRVDDLAGLGVALDRIGRLLARADIRQRGDRARPQVVIERFVPGREYAVEGIVERGVFRALAVFDKPDPLDGPFFEESIYVTPSRLSADEQRRVVRGIARAVEALGLRHGPVHAECRVNDRGVGVLEVAARPIGGLCARALRFERSGVDAESLEGVLLRHAVGESVDEYRRESAGSAVMMIPIPRAGIYRRTDGVEAASACPGVVEVVMTAKPDQRLEPPPEGGSYLGFIFARADTPAAAEQALRQAHQHLRIVMDAPIPVVSET